MQLDSDLIFNQPTIEQNQKFFGDEIELENSMVLPNSDRINKATFGRDAGMLFPASGLLDTDP